MKRASKPAPAMKPESRRCWKRWPMTYTPGASVTPRRCRNEPSACTIGRSHPVVVRAVAGRQDDRPDPFRAQVEVTPGARCRDGRRTDRGQHLAGQAGAVDVPVDGVQEGVHPPIGVRRDGREPVPERRVRPSRLSSRPVNRTPGAAARPGPRRSRPPSAPVRPTSCIDGSRRAAAGSGISSIVRASRPVASSHQ